MTKTMAATIPAESSPCQIDPSNNMPNVAQVLKSEITRITKKELRAETHAMKKVQASLRSDIAVLKKHALGLEQAIRALGKNVQVAAKTTQSESPMPPAGKPKTRFSAKSLASQRKRLGLSAEDIGRLIGSSGQSVYNWEAGKARPRDSHMEAIAALKSLGRRAAVAHLSAMDSAAA